MITFNLQADNGNYYRGHKPDNCHGNCWVSERRHALTLTLEQSRRMVDHKSNCCSQVDIIIATESEPISDEECDREMFYLDGGCYYNYKEGSE